LESVWSSRQQAELAGFGIEVAHIREAYKVLRDIDGVQLLRRADFEKQEQVVSEVITRCALRRAGSRTATKCSGWSEQDASARLIITGDMSDPEASYVSQVMRRLLQAMQISVEVVHQLDAPRYQFPEASYMLVLLTRGALSCAGLAATLVANQRLDPGIELVPILADSSFVFPDEETWQNLVEGNILWDTSLDLWEVACAYKALLNVLALKFTPSGSIGVINMEIQEMLPRFRSITNCVMISVGPESRSQTRSLTNVEDHSQHLPGVGLSLTSKSGSWQHTEDPQHHLKKLAIQEASYSQPYFDASIESEFEFGGLVPRRSACPMGVTGNLL